MSIFAWSLTSGLSGRRKDNSSEQIHFLLDCSHLQSVLSGLPRGSSLEKHTVSRRLRRHASGALGFNATPRATTSWKHRPVTQTCEYLQRNLSLISEASEKKGPDVIQLQTKQSPDKPPASCRCATKWTVNTVDSLFLKWVCQAEVVGKDVYQHHHERSGGSCSMHSLWAKLRETLRGYAPITNLWTSRMNPLCVVIVPVHLIIAGLDLERNGSPKHENVVIIYSHIFVFSTFKLAALW